jgi:AraC-like DNA-binding protein
MYILDMLGTHLLFDDPVSTPIGGIRLAGTSSGPSGVADRVLSDYAWVYVVSGEAFYSDELGTDVRLVAGDGLLIVPDVRHSNGALSGQNWDHIYFVFDGPVFRMMVGSGVFRCEYPVTHLEPIEEWTERFLEMATRERPHDARQRTMLLYDFASLLSSAVIRPESDETWISRASTRLAQDGGRGDITSVAREFNLSYDAFRKRFRREAGQSPAAYQEKLRAETVAELLRSTSLTTRQIAAVLGYLDEFHLSRRFKASFGVAPGRFRSEESAKAAKRLIYD